ncbi:MAG TPA: transketolase [Verrucomicrobiales bacterium]|nr:transketolase [Verrucomicrobiales bacterium]HIL69211.1 transketolase [Verrucomicrobiota bacterium]
MIADIEALKDLARRIRSQSLKMTHHANASHVGTSLSMADLLAVLYGEILNVRPEEPGWPGRDRFILSKGHGAAALYATLAETGFIPTELLESYCDNGASLTGHVSHAEVSGVEVSTGSLGHGLSIACGFALSAKRDRKPWKSFVLLSDGECDEGSIWEAALFAPQHRLDNLTAIIDYNKIQSFGTVEEVIDLHPLAEKWSAFRWAVREVDGHDVSKIREVLSATPFEKGKPNLIIAHTTKGKGVRFMENKLLWHYKSPNADQLKEALCELNSGT